MSKYNNGGEKYVFIIFHNLLYRKAVFMHFDFEATTLISYQYVTMTIFDLR